MIDFIGKRRWFFLISAIVIIPSLASLAIFGLKPGVDFTSGTAITWHFGEELELSQLRQELANLGYDKAIVQPVGKGEFFVRLPEIASEEIKRLKDSLEIGLDNPVTISSLYSVSPIVTERTRNNTVWAIIAASIGILLYVAWAFRKMPKPVRWGICAIGAIGHDLVMIIGIFSVLGWVVGLEVDALFVTGVLAVVGVSVNNTVVVFDRIRDNYLRQGVSKNFEVVVNYGINESVGRSLNTGFAVLFVIVALYLFGGVTIHNLILALLIGIATGIYTSLCIAGPLLVVWEKGRGG